MIYTQFCIAVADLCGVCSPIEMTTIIIVRERRGVVYMLRANLIL
jgi:hypothetical protein